MTQVEGFEAVLPGTCVISNGSVSPNIPGTFLTATNLIATLSPNSATDVFLCAEAFADENENPGHSRHEQDVHAIRAGSNTGSDWILVIDFLQPTNAFGFQFSDVANTGPLEFIVPALSASTLIAPCCDGPHEGFFGFVSQAAFTQVLIRSPVAGDDAVFSELQVGWVRKARR